MGLWLGAPLALLPVGGQRSENIVVNRAVHGHGEAWGLSEVGKGPLEVDGVTLLEVLGVRLLIGQNDIVGTVLRFRLVGDVNMHSCRIGESKAKDGAYDIVLTDKQADAK